MLDILSGAPFGCATIALVTAGIVVGFGEFNVFRTAKLLPYAAIGVGTLIYHGLFLFLLRITGHVVPWGATLWRVVLPSMILNTLLMPVVYALMRRLWGHAQAKSVAWE